MPENKSAALPKAALGAFYCRPLICQPRLQSRKVAEKADFADFYTGDVGFGRLRLLRVSQAIL
jgi:hypothetical protein